MGSRFWSQLFTDESDTAMAQQASFTLTTRGTVNGAPTATVNYLPVFAGQRDPNGYLVSHWQEQSAISAIGFSDVVLKSRPIGPGVELQRINGSLSIPTLDVTAPATGTGIQPAPSVAYAMDFTFGFKLPTRGTTAEKWELFFRAKDLMTKAFIEAMVKSNEQVN